MLKAGGQVVVDKAWRVGKAPCDWRNAVIVPIHKKGIVKWIAPITG